MKTATNDLKKPIAKFCPNGIIKFYNPDGSPNLRHGSSFWNKDDEITLAKTHNIIYA